MQLLPLTVLNAQLSKKGLKLARLFDSQLNTLKVMATSVPRNETFERDKI